MAIQAHGDRKYEGTTELLNALQLPSLRIERRRLSAGYHQPGICQSNELAFVLSGRTVSVQSANGVTRRNFIEPGASCVCSAGTFEKASGTASPLECLHIYLPPSLIEQSALADYGIDASRAELRYTGAIKDPMLYQFGMVFNNALNKDPGATGRLFLGGMQAALAAFLLEKYSVHRWRISGVPPHLNTREVRRVVDYIESHFAEDIGLSDLAAETGLSEYHLTRSFRETMGLSPQRYLMFRRVQEAQKLLEESQAPFEEIALLVGFDTAAEFIEVFHHVAGHAPEQYRKLRRS